MTYGKLVNNKLEMVPPQITYLGRVFTNPSADLLEELGYKPVIFTVPPEVPDGSILLVTWTESTEAITQGWNVVTH